jgi:hypothetical protein
MLKEVKTLVKFTGKLVPLLLAVMALALITVGARADTPNEKPWVAGAPIPPNPAPGGGATGANEGGCAAVIGGKIYHAFGFDPGSGDTTGLRIYNPTTDTWSLGPSAPPPGRSEFYQGVAHGGKLYCIGGRPDGNPVVFDTATGIWSFATPLPSGPRSGLAAATFANSIFIFGGRGPGAPCSPGAIPAGTGLTSNILRYDIDKGTWSGAGNLVIPRSDATAARVGSKIYIFGGCNTTASYPDFGEVYDIRTGTSTLLPVPMPGGGRADLAAAGPQSGGSANASHRIHITGGANHSTGGPSPALNHLMWEVDEEVYEIGVPMPTHCPPGVNRGEHQLNYHGDRIFATGGACPGFGLSINNLDIQKLSDPPPSSASMTAFSCDASTFPPCPVQPPGVSAVFVTGTGFAPLGTVTLASSSQGGLPPAVTDVQGEFTATYVDTSCNGQPDTLIGTDSSGNSATITFVCP